MGHSRSLFLNFCLFDTVDTKQMFYIKSFPMTGFEPRTSGVGSDRSTNWATTISNGSLGDHSPCFFLNGPSPASFSLFSSFQYTVDSKQMFNINFFCWWLDSNRGPLVLEATPLPAEPQPLPLSMIFSLDPRSKRIDKQERHHPSFFHGALI